MRVSFFLTENSESEYVSGQVVVGGLASNAGLGPVGHRRVPTFIIVILGQVLAIASLSAWIYVEYLNNLYLREYVTGFLFTEGWILGVLAIVIAMGSLTSLIFRKRPAKTVGEVSAEPDVVVQFPVAAELAPKPETAFHPAVAALMADISSRRTALVPAPAAEKVEPKQLLPFKTEDAERPIIQLMINRVAPSPGSMLYPARPIIPQPPVGVVDVGGARAPASSPPPREVGPNLPRNVTTVITGIMPVKKKEHEPPPEENTSSSDA